MTTANPQADSQSDSQSDGQNERFANWDMSAFFPEDRGHPGFDGPAYRAFRDRYKERVAELLGRAGSLGPLTEESAPAWAALLKESESLYADAIHLFIYLNCLASADANNEALQTESGSLTATLAEQGKIDIRAREALRAASEAAFEKLVADPALAGAEFAVRRKREDAQQTMPVELEELAEDLAVTGFHAWDRLYSQLAGKMEFDLKRPDGEVERVPMAKRRSLLENPDPAVRAAAFDGGNAEWERFGDVFAAALNSIAGARLALQKRRGVGHFLDEALRQSRIERATLDALMGAMEESREIPRRYLRLKAKLLGMERLGFADLSAPLPLKGFEPLSWGGARRRILRAFGASYPALGEFSRLAFEKRWIESEARAGKRPGGYCASSHVLGESRVFMTYNDTLGDAQTLAHELGHAFHNWVMRDMRTLARGYPMTLAETASTFAETIFTDAVLADPEASETDKAAILDTCMDGAASFLLDIPMRFQFERAFHEERAKGEVGLGRIKELMLDAQRDCFGDALDPERMDPWFWASKLHFYKTRVSFYNFPYSFGYLFSLGAIARFRAEGASFLPKYEELLRLTGSDTAEGVARRALGVDLTSREFWLESIALIEQDLARWEEVAPRAVGVSGASVGGA